MTSRLVCNLANLVFLVSLATNLDSHRVFSKIDIINSECQRFIKCSNLALKNSTNNTLNKISKIIRTDNKSFTLSDISTLNVNVPNITKDTGYIRIRHSYDARLFYFFFESRNNKNDPVVLWLTEGPGVGSAKTLFYDNGPFHINDDLSLKWNDFGWDKICNILYVDQPTGVGFSYSSDQRDIRTNSKKTFFQAHPHFLKKDFYIAGASYSGHTIPLLASQIYKQNMAKEGIHISLKGIAITNGFMNPEYTYSSLPDYIYAKKLILRSSYDMLKEFNKECLTLIKRCQNDDNICKNARDLCNDIQKRIRSKMGHPNTFDYRRHFPSSTRIVAPKFLIFFALDRVKNALGIENRTYVTFNDEVFEAMANDYMKNYPSVIPPLLDNGIKTLIFDGECDLSCNWLGNLRWLSAMKWSGQSQFLKTKLTSYKVDGKEVGKIKNTRSLTFLKVFAAGHVVCANQPYVSLNIFKNWINS